MNVNIRCIVAMDPYSCSNVNPLSRDLDKLTVRHLVTKLPNIYRTRGFITVIIVVPILGQLNPVHTFPSYFSTICSNVILSSTPKPSKWSLLERWIVTINSHIKRPGVKSHQ